MTFQSYDSLDGPETRLILMIAGLCDAAGNLTEEASDQVFRETSSDYQTYEYLCRKGLVRADPIGLGGYGKPSGLTEEGLACVAAIKEASASNKNR